MTVDELEVSLLVSLDDDTDLDLDADGYEVVSWGPGALQWRRRTVEGSYQAGRRAILEVPETGTAVGIVRVTGSNWAEVASRAQTMFDALSQHQYVITEIIEGVSRFYICEPAEIEPGDNGQIQKFHAMANMQEYRITVPYDPVGELPS